jgi:hypothetical protein
MTHTPFLGCKSVFCFTTIVLSLHCSRGLELTHPYPLVVMPSTLDLVVLGLTTHHRTSTRLRRREFESFLLSRPLEVCAFCSMLCSDEKLWTRGNLTVLMLTSLLSVSIVNNLPLASMFIVHLYCLLTSITLMPSRCLLIVSSGNTFVNMSATLFSEET